MLTTQVAKYAGSWNSAAKGVADGVAVVKRRLPEYDDLGSSARAGNVSILLYSGISMWCAACVCSFSIKWLLWLLHTGNNCNVQSLLVL